jgi:U6 snRNA-associated Sm-like protein LSm6
MSSESEVKASLNSSSTLKKNPSDFLRQIIGKPVLVKLNSGVSYKGILACLDGFMNIAMEQTEEYHPDESGGLGHLKAKYGDCFIRGNNG